jgi:predicted acylesterase/phospholipase RssA
MQDLLDKYITAEVLQRVAAAHDDNRRLFVGTTNLDYDQTWVWNMGLIAKQGGAESLELYKKVLRASASPPIAFPPVEIAGHLFGDGGVRQNIVVIGLAGDEKPQPPKYGPGTIYVIHNGKETKPPHALSNSALHIAGPVLDTMLTSSMETLLLRSYFAAHARGYRFKLVAIPDAPDIGHNALAFDHQQMQVCFDVGYALARQPDPWLTQPRALDDIPGWAFELMGM